MDKQQRDLKGFTGWMDESHFRRIGLHRGLDGRSHSVGLDRGSWAVTPPPLVVQLQSLYPNSHNETNRWAVPHPPVVDGISTTHCFQLQTLSNVYIPPLTMRRTIF